MNIFFRNLQIFGKVEFILVLIFISNQLLEKANYYTPFIHSYLDDLIAIPITLAITRHIMFYLHKPTFYSLYSPSQIVVVVCMFSVYFEWYLPSKYSFHYRDYYDIVCYAVGGLGYYILLHYRRLNLLSEKEFFRSDKLLKDQKNQ